MRTGPRTSSRRIVSNLYPSVFVGGTWTVVVLLTLAAHTIAYLVQCATPGAADIIRAGGLGFVEFQSWQLVSHMFLFDATDPAHFIFTMTIFLMVAGDVSVVMGWRRFLLFYLACGLIGGVGTLLWIKACLYLLPGVKPLAVVGPTGGICALVFAFGHYFSQRRIYGFIPARLYCGLLTVLLVGGTMVLFTLQYGRGTGTPYLGALCSLAGAMIYFALAPRFSHWRLVRHTFSELDQIQDEAILRETLDSILAKVSESGTSSLSPAEKKSLRKASRVMTKRQRERS